MNGPLPTGSRLVSFRISSGSTGSQTCFGTMKVPAMASLTEPGLYGFFFTVNRTVRWSMASTDSR